MTDGQWSGAEGFGGGLDKQRRDQLLMQPTRPLKGSSRGRREFVKKKEASWQGAHAYIYLCTYTHTLVGKIENCLNRWQNYSAFFTAFYRLAGRFDPFSFPLDSIGDLQLPFWIYDLCARCRTVGVLPWLHLALTRSQSLLRPLLMSRCARPFSTWAHNNGKSNSS